MPQGVWLSADSLKTFAAEHNITRCFIISCHLPMVFYSISWQSSTLSCNYVLETVFLFYFVESLICQKGCAGSSAESDHTTFTSFSIREREGIGRKVVPKWPKWDRENEGEKPRLFAKKYFTVGTHKHDVHFIGIHITYAYSSTLDVLFLMDL